MDQETRTRILKILELYNAYEKAWFAYLRTFTTIAASFVGLLCALKPATFPNHASLVLFLLSLSLLSLGILFSAIAQHYEIASLKQELAAQRSMLKQYIENPNANLYQNQDLPKPPVYKFCEKATFACWMLSLPTLIGYVYFAR